MVDGARCNLRLTGERICIFVTATRTILYLKVEDGQLRSPPLLCSPKLGLMEMTQRVVVCKDNALVPQQIVTKYFRHGPLECQELQFH